MYIRFLLIILGGLLCTHHLPAQNGQSPDSIPNTPLPQVNLGFGRTSDPAFAGDVTVIEARELWKYDNIEDVMAALEGRIPGMAGGISLHGLGNAHVLVDGTPRALSTVSVQEIAQITVLKDVNSAVLFGTDATNGVILIKTKRGLAGKAEVSGWTEYGVEKISRLPDYLNAADYMSLYNEALTNDGLPELYTAGTIEGSRSGTNPLKYPDNDYYDLFTKNSRNTLRAGAEFSGGNENAQYYLHTGFLNSGSFLKVGEGGKEQTNAVNLRSNINFKVNNFIKSHLDIAASYSNQRQAVGDFWENASLFRPHEYPLLIDTADVPAADAALVKAATLIDGRYLLGGTSQYQTNIYGDMHLGGYRNSMRTWAQFTNGITVDLAFLTKGLSFSTYASFDFYKVFREEQNNVYAVYEITAFDGDRIAGISAIGDDQFTGKQGVGDAGFLRRMNFYGLLNYSRAFDKHAVSASAIAYAEKYSETQLRQDEKRTHLGANLTYVFDRRYTADFSAALVSSAKLASGNKSGFSPALALGWIAINKPAAGVLNYLKLRASAGILKTDTRIGGYYLHQNTYIQGATVNWGDANRSNRATVFSNAGNRNLTFEQRENISFGFDAALFKKSLQVNAGIFSDRITGQVEQRENEYPSYLGGFVPYTNFGENLYQGVQAGVQWNQSAGDFRYSIGANITCLETEVVKTDEIWEHDYLYRTGRPVDALFGLEAAGLFRDPAEIEGHASQTFGQVNPGDIKYVDQNGDEVIDQNDEIMLGKRMPDLAGGLSLRLSYRNVTLFAMATGASGSERFYNNSYYWIYGNRKYSEVVRNRWTPETAQTAAYPRLSTQMSSNNFRNSSFWLYGHSWITLDRLQLSYDFSDSVCKFLKMQHVGFYLRAANLATWSKNRRKMELNVGREPGFRTYSIGLKALF